MAGVWGGCEAWTELNEGAGRPAQPPPQLQAPPPHTPPPLSDELRHTFAHEHIHAQTHTRARVRAHTLCLWQVSDHSDARPVVRTIDFVYDPDVDTADNLAAEISDEFALSATDTEICAAALREWLAKEMPESEGGK
jgi:hypothetical protein